ncbi:uncharacterized protein LOC143072893 [Mytilus galloprovincialis]|uniref:uncharacterized protein LOC143072893 n=1 Tax=Mytilus galloprovincialis TaxID=29158 RepID=UPI003F7B8B6A
MDREDQRRYFIVGSVFMEIVTPLFRQKIEHDYMKQGFRSFHTFISSQSVIHILFHLRHRNTYCCKDQVHCYNNQALPLNYSQWDLLYKVSPVPGSHNCHCQFLANHVQLNDIDITLGSLILLNCCHLGPHDENVVRKLRQYKNDYLSHNTKGRISETEYNTLWADLESFILQLDPNKEDDLIRIEQRPLDQQLCDKYLTCLLDLHKKLDEMDNKLDHQTELLQEIHDVLRNQTMRNESIFLRALSSLVKLFRSKPKQPDRFKLGESIFTLHHQLDLKSVVGDDLNGDISDLEMMDNGRIVLCLPNQRRLLICNTYGSQVDSIKVRDNPYSVTAVNNSTVAVTMYYKYCIEMYDINNKSKLKSLSVPRMGLTGITTLNNKLVVCDNRKLLIIDHQKEEVVQSIKIDCSNDSFFYNNKDLDWYRYTDDSNHTISLPSLPRKLTTLQDGSLYVLRNDKSVQHVSSDGKQYETVTTEGLETELEIIQYNPKQKKLMAMKCNDTLEIFYEKE